MDKIRNQQLEKEKRKRGDVIKHFYQVSIGLTLELDKGIKSRLTSVMNMEAKVLIEYKLS